MIPTFFIAVSIRIQPFSLTDALMSASAVFVEIFSHLSLG